MVRLDHSFQTSKVGRGAIYNPIEKKFDSEVQRGIAQGLFILSLIADSASDIIAACNSARAGRGGTGQGRARLRLGLPEQSRAGQGRAGQGMAGQGRAVQGRAGQGSLISHSSPHVSIMWGGHLHSNPMESALSR